MSPLSAPKKTQFEPPRTSSLHHQQLPAFAVYLFRCMLIVYQLNISNLMHFHHTTCSSQSLTTADWWSSVAVTNILSAERTTGQSTTVSTVKVMTTMWNEYQDKWHMDPICRGGIFQHYIWYIVCSRSLSNRIWAICWLLFIRISSVNITIHSAWPSYESMF